MPQPLPAPIVPSAGGLIEAGRLGRSDYLDEQKRELMKRAGGLAAAGNMSGAQGELYKGGDFDAARGISAEQRAAQSHARAGQSHQLNMDTAKLERALQGQGMLARLAGTITTPEQFETAKQRLKTIGLDVGNVTFDQLPQLRDQALSVQEQMAAEANKRKLDILQQRADAKTNAPVKLTEGQAGARNFLGMAEQAEGVLRGKKDSPGLLGTEGTGKAPISRSDRLTYEGLPPAYRTMFLNKQGKQYFQAAMQFIRAKLRKESGATISPDEFAQDFEVFFPQPGDDGKTIQQKAQARQQILEGLRVQGGMNPNVQTVAPEQAATANAAPSDDPAQWTDEQLDQYLAQ